MTRIKLWHVLDEHNEVIGVISAGTMADALRKWGRNHTGFFMVKYYDCTYA